MTEDEFLERWNQERPQYETWGQFVSERVTEEMRPHVKPISMDLFIRIPIKPRVKSDGSFITKAFYRNKPYTNPFDDITDKVGMRVVVLLPDDMAIVCKAIEDCNDWDWSKDRDYEEERDKKPYVFDYQSDHYIVRCRGDKTVGAVTVKSGTPCEIQVRTILQHAHSELTHDTIYKPSVVQTPAMLRAAAKSMALIEATSDYFQNLVEQIEEAVGPNKSFTLQLVDLYRELLDAAPDPTKAEGLLSDAYADILGTQGVAAVRDFLKAKPFVAGQVKERARSRFLFRQPSILLAGTSKNGPVMACVHGIRRFVVLARLVWRHQRLFGLLTLRSVRSGRTPPVTQRQLVPGLPVGGCCRRGSEARS
ncbi:GTP pyrophosphokinase family protein [Reyranella sp.]|uniref:GTP pyrophosphokinase n=1 Tax=Reyranella sp. TaxID=1929291 RepID=UPI00272FCD91|nr:RelA/SpoT domain-containing protein [Reyranella sp.]MDP2377626.1 RelA/SpoT domain-containing protein [Reyranella sp.]